MSGTDDTGDTGRIKATLDPTALRLYYGPPDDAGDRKALRLIARVDRAHLVMLSEQRIIPRDKAAQLIRTVEQAEAADFEDVISRPRPRGLYLAYEQAITDRCGPGVGGLMHTGRSRNDLNATTSMLAQREMGLDLLTGGIQLLDALLRGAEDHLDVLLPIHTHYQPAMPITLGYYLTGVALALHRELGRVLGLLTSIRRCPLGAHAVAGTDLPIDSNRTATLLGFEEGPLHAVDAIASRDVALDMVGLSAALAATVSRLATDLQLWSTAEFRYITFPDSLVGSSSAMPQKRNAFLLEYLKGRPSRVIGDWVAVITATKSVPFTNSIEVGIEAMAPVAPALRTTLEILTLTAIVVLGIEPCQERAARAAAEGFVDATALANALVLRGVPFRDAHDQIGKAVLAVLEEDGRWPPEGLDDVDLADAVDQARHGGGPGARAEALAAGKRLRDELSDGAERLRHVQHQAARNLREVSRKVSDG